MYKGSVKKIILIFTITLITVLGVGYALANMYFSQLTVNRVTFERPVISNDASEITLEERENNEVSILLLGTDESGFRTDSMLAVNIDFETQTVSMFSIPRDYRVDLTDDIKEMINHNSDYVKLTELHAYAKGAGYESPVSLTSAAAEEFLGFRFNHIVLFNLKAFNDIVDAVGGVEVNVPKRLYYQDPYQDLYIDLYPGVQLLDGKQAESLVRYRKDNSGDGYGDFNRMEVQQYVLKAFVKKLISAETAGRVNELFEIVKQNVITDADLNDVLYLLGRAREIDFNRLYSHTLPGTDASHQGKYYYDPPELEALHELVHEQIEKDKLPTTSSKDVDIVVLNGTGKNQMAAKYRDILAGNGYTISDIGTYYNEHTMKTRIIVPKDGMGKDLQSYFDLSEIIVDPEAEGITIILGMLTE